MSIRNDGTRDESQPVEGFNKLYQVYQIIVDEPTDENLNKQLNSMDLESLCLLGSLSRSINVLEKLYLKKDSSNHIQLLVEIAKNISTPPRLLVEMSYSISEDILVAIAMNPTTPVDALNRLFRHPTAHIRRALTGNPSLPIDTLQELLGDKNSFVVSDALRVLRVRNDSVLHGMPSSWIRKILG